MKVYEPNQFGAGSGSQRQSGHSRTAEDWLLVVQEIAGVGIWDWRIDHVAATCTESNTVLYGLPPCTVMPPMDQWKELIHPDDRCRVLDELQSAASGLAEYQT